MNRQFFGKILMLGKTEGKGRSGWQRMRQLDIITDSTDINLSKLQEKVDDRGVCHAIVHVVEKSDFVTERQQQW